MTFALNNFESFDPPSRGTGISSAVLRYRAPKLPARKPIAHITNHGDVFCVGCKTPDRYDDGHLWLPVFETGKRRDTCDECERMIGDAR